MYPNPAPKSKIMTCRFLEPRAEGEYNRSQAVVPRKSGYESATKVNWMGV